jgi:hypothetical protein
MTGSFPVLADQICVFQDLQVLRDGWSTDREMFGEFSHAQRASAKQLKNCLASRIGDDRKDR